MKKDLSKTIPLMGFIFFIWVCDYFITPIQNILPKKRRIEVLKANEWLFSICLISSDFLGIFVDYIFKKWILSKEEKEQYGGNENEKKKIIKSWKVVLFSSFLGFCVRICNFLYIIIVSKELKPLGMIWILLVDFCLRLLFFKIGNFGPFIKVDIYSLVLLIISSLLPIIFFIIDKKEYFSESLAYILFIFLKFIIIPLEDFINNYLLYNKGKQKALKPHSVMFVRGIVNIFLMIILTIFFYFFDLVNLKYLFQNQDKKELLSKIIISILTLIFGSLKSFTILLLITIFTAIPASFCNFLLILYKYVQSRAEEEKHEFNMRDINSLIYSFVIILIILDYSGLISIDFDKKKNEVKGNADSSMIDQNQNQNIELLHVT